ncbi:iron-containing redox enzyme family protein [Aetokthonos hydrillicola Thurmond2011]|jgi:pyrroloquinoline-quinone synthase|uniref:Iron-containing redox enzyme family protein n=1 Tax=Aetokthonos hydrillicola Thurmond2011 TaxID=2712845 RepID=A0AAP5MCS6_9CYAN|nr:iron-containing redox enzyme family protein [Aetokthonos hydrillicola]MBO3459767.1 iron-containing redox enzyme family protein [Aetokthonos hydrillicola CCALA 1050]MBW4585200.1 iron-containing redox enzyme family protein [Aetokthonos hydrillicola CCALA 1050]MDR9899537.1 iron-containing redox enzyme family protein [Aetokthonos hydrillicola Thurmond2011]
MTALKVEEFEQIQEPNVRQRLEVNDEEIRNYLNEKMNYILNHRAVQHPLLNYYRKNKFTKEQEKKFYLECWYYFQYEPFYIVGIAMNTRDYNILREVVLNVVDEVGGKVTHETLFREQINELGISDEEIDNYKCLPTTTAINTGAMKLYTEPPVERALGALYADETMSAVLATQLNEGLENQGYDKNVRKHWLMHLNVEIGHSNNAFNAIAPYVSHPQGRSLFEAGLNQYLELLEAYWDGVDSIVRG